MLISVKILQNILLMASCGELTIRFIVVILVRVYCIHFKQKTSITMFYRELPGDD